MKPKVCGQCDHFTVDPKIPREGICSKRSPLLGQRNRMFRNDPACEEGVRENYGHFEGPEAEETRG